MADVSDYHQVFAEFHGLGDAYGVFRAVLEDVAGKVDFGRVRRCVALGTGSAQREIDFARRLMPNLRSFVAVEPDPKWVEELRANFRKGLLRDVETSAVESSIQSWSGVDGRVDAVLLFNVLHYLDAADRKALYRNLTTHYLNDGGLVVISQSVDSETSGYIVAMARLGGKRRVGYDEVAREMAAAGFRALYERDFDIRRDMFSPAVVNYVRLRSGRGESEVRAVIDDVSGLPNFHIVPNKLAIFTK